MRKVFITLLLCLRADSVDLSITADNYIIELYFDGKPVSFAAGEWTSVRKVSMPTRTRTIAVKCQDTGVCIADNYFAIKSFTID